MDDEDGEASNKDSWTPEQLSSKEAPVPEDSSRLRLENECYDGETDSEERAGYRGVKKTIFPESKETKVSADAGKAFKDKKITEYAQYLGLQPAGKYKCAKCRPTVTFYSISMLKEHEFVCQAASSTPGPSEHRQQVSSSTKSSPRPEKSSSALIKNNFRITRKVYLCSACGTYFENWNLFLHMRETHKRHICLFCLGMFGQAERLSNHLIKKHSVQIHNFNNIESFYQVFKGSCYLLCCDCEKVFSETENFSEHFCASPGELPSPTEPQQQPSIQQPQQQPIIQPQPVANDPVCLCRPAGKHQPGCKLGNSQDRHLDRVNNKRTLLPNPANKVAKMLLTKKAKLENDLYQSKLANLYSRKPAEEEEEEEEEEEQEDIEGDYGLNNYFKGSEATEKSRLLELDVARPTEKSDRYTDTIMQVSRCSDDWDSDDKDRDEDAVNSLDEMEQGELILDDGKEDSVESLPSPIPEASPTSSPARYPTPSPEKTTGEATTETSATTEDSPVKESPATCTRVNSSNRSLVIKICTNKNSQFSIATPNSNGTYGNESADETKEDSDKDTDSASDSDTGKLTVALPEPSEAPNSPELEPEREETKETEATPEDPPAPPSEIATESPEEDKTSDENPDKSQDQDESRQGEALNPTGGENQQIQEPDGVLLASGDAPSIDLNVVGLLESMEIDELLKLCIEAASPSCVYCNHARHIAINGKQLALHMLAEHRFQPQHPAIIIHREQLIARVKKSLEELENLFLNFDSYDSRRGTYAFPQVRTYECYLCRIYFTIHKDLYVHNRKLHQKTILVCIMCKSSFFNHSELLCHLCPGVYAAGGTLRYRCCMCSVESLPSSFRLMVHLRKRHDTCDVCLESTGNQQKLSNHVWKHKLHHLCYRCGIAYRNKPDITKHLFWKHGTESVVCKKCLQKKWPHVYHFCIPPSEFVCEECGAKFSRAVALKVHKRLHTGDAPYGCSECPEKFISKKLAGKHQEAHRQPEIPPAPDPEPDKVEACQDKQAEDPEVSKEPVRKVVDVYDLPPLNLSSESDSSEDEKLLEKDKEKVEEEDKEIYETRIEINEVPEEIQLSEANDEADEADKQEVVIMNGIWDNFKTYAASLGSDLAPEVELKATNDEILKNIAAEHDYWVVYEAPKEEIQEAREEIAEDRKKKSPKKKKSGSSSSSDSSSDSDSSSCSCGTNCSCSSSSSGSSSSSSSSSDSDSSTESHKQSRKDRRKERESKRKKEEQIPQERENGVCEENPEPLPTEVPEALLREALPLRESDLETTETETDEDFYDENPQQHANRLLAERRNQPVPQESVPAVGATEVKNGAVESGNPEENCLPVKSKPTARRKIKTKRRKKLETLEARESVRGRGRGRPPGSTKASSMGALKLNIPKNILFQKKNPSPPTFNTIDEFMYHSNYHQVAENTLNSSAMSATSENEASVNDSKRSSKRKRIPKRFYGDSSDEEHQRQVSKWQRPNQTIPYVPSITIKQNFGPPPPQNKAYPGQDPPVQPAVISQPVESPAPVSVHAAVNATTDSDPADSSSDSSSEEDASPRATHPPINNLGATGPANVYCYCRCPYDEVSEMIACDGGRCRIEWFHFECVGIMVPPKGKWYCPDCLQRDGVADNQIDQ